MSKAGRRLLVIGSRGFLGAIAAQEAALEYEVIGASRTAGAQLNELQIDVRDEGSVRSAFQIAQPDAVVLLSAISDIDRCEKDPEEARAVNLRGAEHIVNACSRSKVRLLFTSTGAVFDGRLHGYTEECPVSPVSVYGQTKAEAEKLVLAFGRSAIVVRLSLVLGFGASSGTNSLMDKLKERWVRGEIVALPVFEQRNPIDAVTASRFMIELLRKPEASGIFHIGCKESITRHHLGLKLASRMGYPGQVSEEHQPAPGRAPRGPDHYLLTEKLRRTCQTPVPSCDQAIERCFDGLA
jgi:dTDP-4-dehydrorhamnose reductase